MEVLLNEKSIRMQFTEDGFIEYIRNEILPVMKILSDNHMALLKDYSTYDRRVTRDKTMHDFIQRKGNPLIDRLKDHLVQLACVAPFWNDNIHTREAVKYICDIREIPNCITETLERGGILFSFKNGKYDKNCVDVVCDGEKKEVRNFFDFNGLKRHLVELGLLIQWNSNSFYVGSIGYKFEIRFREDNHNMPHFHLSRTNEAASLSIPDADIIVGELKDSRKAISWSLQNMGNIAELWNQYHPDKKVLLNP